MARRRERGQGSVYQRASDRMWVASVRLDDGRRRSLYRRSRPEAMAALQDLNSQLQRGLPIPDRQATVAQHARAWLEFKAGSVRPITVRRYEQLIRLHVLPELGAVRLPHLTPSQLAGLYQRLLRKGLGPHSVAHVHTALRAMLADAVKWNLASRNVAQLVKPPSFTPRRVQVLSRDQATRLLDAAKGDHLEFYWNLLLGMGLRSGEALALQWQDIDLANSPPVLHVRRTITDARGGYSLGEPKTHRSRRAVALSDGAIAALSRQERGEPGVWVTARPDGRPYTPANMTPKHLRPLLRRAGLPETLRVHDLRHSLVSIALDGGLPVGAVSELVGHSSTYMTLHMYTHALPGASAATVKAVAKLMARDPEPKPGR